MGMADTVQYFKQYHCSLEILSDYIAVFVNEILSPAFSI